MSGGLFGLAGQFASEYMTAVMSGQALGGIFAAVAEIISLTFGAAATTTAFVYFNIGNFTLIISIICYILMCKTLFFKFHIHESGGMLKSASSSSEIVRRSDPAFGTVLGKIWLYGFSEWFVFVTTLSVYPSVTVLINSQNSGNKWNGKFYFVLLKFNLF